MTRFVPINLAQLPAPTAVVPPVYEDIVSQIKQAVLDRLDEPLKTQVGAVLAIESEPIVKVIEACAYRELLVYQRINEAVQAVLLSSAQGADLDNLAARLDVLRMTLVPAAGSTPAVMEGDPDLKYRYQLAPNAFSTAGPALAYEYLARSAHPEVADAAVYGPESGLVSPGQVLVVILGRNGDGTPSLDCLNAVRAKLTHEDTVPDTDEVLVRGAIITPYSIRYRLQVLPGADPTLIVNQAVAALTQYTTSARKVGRVVTVSALDACANADTVNVVRAVKISPVGEIDPGPDGATYCSSIAVEFEVAS